jgi:hypothetical protein
MNNKHTPGRSFLLQARQKYLHLDSLREVPPPTHCAHADGAMRHGVCVVSALTITVGLKQAGSDEDARGMGVCIPSCSLPQHTPQEPVNVSWEKSRQSLSAARLLTLALLQLRRLAALVECVVEVSSCFVLCVYCNTVAPLSDG